RRISLSEEDEELFDKHFEESIQTAAVKNQLTPMCVKKLLKVTFCYMYKAEIFNASFFLQNIVVNEHVFAIVRLKEEEDARKVKDDDSKESNDESSENDDDDDKQQPEPKLTRLKAKQLKQIPLPIVSLNEPAPDDDVAALIREELCSDDDDEEYKPAEDEIVSDDDPNATVSDVESQPRTPSTTAAALELDSGSEVQFTKDGLFKIPKPRNDSQCSQSEEQEQENIALRTRSKLCLTTTAIETLESTFIPPDITKDMYEYDGEMDQAWKDFLEEFTRPLPNNLEDDDDNDPEYVAAEGIPFDPEEMRTLKVSKKELNELVQELMEMGAADDQTMLEETLTETINESLNCHIVNNRAAMLKHESNCIDDAIQSTMVESNVTAPAVQFSSSSMLPSEPSTKELIHNSQKLDNSQNQYNPPIYNLENVGCETNLHMPTNSSMDGSDYDGATFSSTANIPMTSNESNRKNVLYNQPDFQDFSSSSRVFMKYSFLEETPVDDSNTLKRYRIRFSTVPVEVNVSKTVAGMNDFQFQLLHQQLRMHVQLTTQHFLQSYGHPKHWNLAAKCKTMLTELEEIGKTKPNIVPWNLSLAIDCCQSWEAQLAEDDANTKSLMKFWLTEMKREENEVALKRIYHSDFHWLVREKIINCRTFIYPFLIPYKAFRTIVPTQPCHNFKSEKHLIALWLERGYEKLKNDANYMNSKKGKGTVAGGHVCDYIAKHWCSTYSASRLKNILYKHKSDPVNLENPISFFLVNGYAPPFEHVLEAFDPNNVIPLSQYVKGTLHYNWEKYIFSEKRVPVDKSCGCNKIEQKPSVHNGPPQMPLPPVVTTNGTDNKYTIDVLHPGREAATNQEKNVCISLQNSEKNVNELVNNDAADVQVGAVVRVCYDKFVVNVVKTDTVSLNVEGLSDVKNNDISSNESGISDKPIFASPQCLSLSRENVTKSSVQHVNLSRSAAVATLYSAMKRYLQQLKNEVKQETTGSLLSKATHPFYRVYAHFKTLEVYCRFLDELRTMSENLAAYQYRPLPHCYFQQSQKGLLRLSCSHRTDGSIVIGAEYATGLFGDYRSMEDKDATYAFNYYEKVEETLLASGRADLLERFEQILRNFDESENRVSVLYYQIEDLLGESFPQLLDMFLTFLLPGQAGEVGKFFEHFILTNMGDFLEKLNVFFVKQPSQIKKIHACLNELSNEPEVTMEQVKMKVLPLLKGSTLLTEWFLQLFPGERPPEYPLCDYEHIGLKKHALNESFDAGSVYEHVSYVETLPEVTEIPCTSNAIRYIQGRIFQGALPARLTFLANNCLTKQTVDQPSSEDAVTNGDHLCDDSTLLAHAIRLNPLVHCPKGITYADVAHLLVESNGETEAGRSPESSVVNANVDDECKGGTNSKKLTPKLQVKKRFNSPSPRKAGSSPGDDKSSPAGNKDVSLQKKMAPNVPVTIPPESKALAAARKLKSLVDAPQTSSQEERQLDEPSTIVQKCCLKERPEAIVQPKQPSAFEVSNSTSSNTGEMREEPEGQKEANSIDAPSWTREEDKIILQDIIKGYSSVNMFVQQIEQKIPDRTREQI
uniref:Myb-like domain-containing protein n=1 Tax=Anopheles christyi TaxID=43041 RepID=A0A182JTZ7_9DIPT